MTQQPPFFDPSQQPFPGQAQAPQQVPGMQPQPFQQPAQQIEQPAHQHYPGQQQQYPAQQQQYPAQQQPWQPPAYVARDKANTFGVIALAILLLNVLMHPILAYSTLNIGVSEFQAFNAVVSWVHAILDLTAVGFAVAGVLQRDATRLRWTAVGALTAGALTLFSSGLFWLTGWIYNITT